MDKRYFTVEEANRMIPRLVDAFNRIFQMRAQLRSTFRQLQQTGFAPESDDFELDPPGAGADVVRQRATLKALANAMRDELAQLHDDGCLVKDLDTGLVDWFSRKDGRDVFLCWRLGEKTVSFWHELETGFAGRRPISELVGPDPSADGESN